MTPQAQALGWLEVQLGRAVGDAFSAALAIEEPGSSSPAWDQLLGVWGVPPISAEERERLRVGASLTHGAPPDELYAVLTRIGQWATTRLPDAYDCDGPDERRYNKLRSRIGDLHGEWLGRYKSIVMPAPTSMFAHALEAANRSGPNVTTAKRTIILRCQNCAGPRLTESEYECEFCGHHLGESGPRRQW